MESRKRKRRGKKEDYSPRTHLIHGNYESKRWDYDHHVVPPMSSSSTYRLDSSQRGAQGFLDFACDTTNFQRQIPIYIYDRLDEPTRGMLEENLAHAEGGEICVTFATGMAAISAALGVSLEAGEQIISHQIVYGCTYSLLTNWFPRLRIDVKFVDLADAERLRDAIQPETRVVYFESPVNPNLQLIDIAAVRHVVDQANASRGEHEKILIVIDNTFATPFCQRPLELGADMVVHSLTKDICGFGTEMGGAVITSRQHYNHLMLYRKDFGGVLAPKSAWAILVYGLPTLAARMVNQQKSAMKVAQFLENHPKIARVLYPGLESFPQYELARSQMRSYDGKFAPGSMLYFQLKEENGGNEAAEKFIDFIAEHAYTITLAVSLGQIRTLIENPFSMTHSALPVEQKVAKGIEPGGIRLSLGLEDWHDIIGDLDAALAQT